MGQSHYWFAFAENGISYYPLPYSYQTTWLLISTISAFFKLLVKRPLAVLPVFSTIKKDYQKNKGIKGGRNWLLDFIRLAACKQIQPNVIHNQWSPALAALEPLFNHYPIVQSLHANLEDFTPFCFPKMGEIYSKFFPRISGFQSASIKALSNAKLFGINTENIKVTYTSVDENVLTSKIFLQTQKNKASQIKIVSVGDYVWRKGHVYALEAMSILKRKGLNFNFEIYGKGDMTEDIFNRYDLNLTTLEVQLFDRVDHNLVLNKIEKASLFLLPSVQEGFATVATEAMALGVPVVSTTCDGMQEKLKHKVNAFLVEPMNPYQIAEAIEEVQNTPEDDLSKIISNAKELVRNELTWEIQIENYLKLYQNSLN
jgi:colanic acid/amylovoran biosynthesis glycosyltransferase